VRYFALILSLLAVQANAGVIVDPKEILDQVGKFLGFPKNLKIFKLGITLNLQLAFHIKKIHSLTSDT